MARTLIGIDIGGSGIKGAPVEVVTGEPSPRTKILTPKPATPQACAEIVSQIVERIDLPGPVGVTVPGVVDHGVVKSAANIDKSWLETDASSLFSEAIGRPVLVINDADAAGIAEMRVGAGVGRNGTVAILTLGTGIGSAVFADGHLLTNTELGHVEFKGSDTEHYISGKMRNDLTWDQWAGRVSELITYLAFVLGLDLVILGGGVSKSWDTWSPLLDVPVEVVPAELRNYAGIVGAAMATADFYPGS